VIREISGVTSTVTSTTRNYKALCAGEFINLTSLVGRFYAGSALNI